ncbi:ATP-binding protein [Nitrospirillum sp. BR 11163]|uniref:ATP-binding protein n=1 Tax=Nitrospirillum sp. BR 11163 TaxID=3104323 RepID=UPI002AFFC020|nr:ATP-binding protein [Nitrospirillum sp. BR 11163]MEA1676642.1 ATP-binding protein [Nitrospirillum sp. BR 11163]
MRAVTDRMSYSIFAVLVGGILLSQAIALGLYRTDRAEAVAAAQSGQLAGCLASIAGVVDHQPADIRDKMLAGLRDGNFKVNVAGTTQDVSLDVYEKPKVNPPGPRHTDMIALPPFGTITTPPPEPKYVMASHQLADGSWLNVHIPMAGADALSEPGFLASLAGSAAVAILLSAWVLGFTTRPLRRFAAAADRLGVDMNAPSLDETGPREVRLAAAAFNKMQRRLRAFVEDRTRMLAAVSHDLRTPLTRMRLRAEFVDDDGVREKMLEDLGEMESMIGATLAFARDEAAQETLEPLDLNLLLSRAAEDYRDAGKPVGFSPAPGPVRVVGRRTALKRAFTNVVENALKYGASADVAVAVMGETVAVSVTDQGPGIPEAEWDNVFRPFYRLEASRSRDTGGTGLGLSVANDVVRAHGGEIRLENRAEGGLRVILHLPLEAAR